MTRSGNLPLEYLRECSNSSLRYFEMSKLEHAANLRRELAVLLDEMMEETALALLARWMLDRRCGRTASAAPRREPGANVGPAASELIVGWLSSARQVEGAAALPRGGNGRVRGNSSTGDPGSSVSPLREKKNPPAPCGQGPGEAAVARAERRAARKAIGGDSSQPGDVPPVAGQESTG